MLFSDKITLSIDQQTDCILKTTDLIIINKLRIIFDLTFATIFIILFSPVYILISLGVKFSSKGSVIYKQERIGQYGKPFLIYKF